MHAANSLNLSSMAIDRIVDGEVHHRCAAVPVLNGSGSSMRLMGVTEPTRGRIRTIKKYSDMRQLTNAPLAHSSLHRQPSTATPLPRSADRSCSHAHSPAHANTSIYVETAHCAAILECFDVPVATLYDNATRSPI